MASTNSNKGRAVVLSAACVTMFFISSIALYSVVSKNLLAVYPEWSSALTWAFPVFQTIMAVTGIFAGRISDKIGPRNVVIAAAACYGLGWFMSGTVTEPWQFYLWVSLVAAIGNGLGYNPALTTGQKWFIDKKGLASGITLAASTAGPAVLSPVLASLLIPSLGIFGALKALGVIFFVTIAASALFLKAPEAGWLPEGFEEQEHHKDDQRSSWYYVSGSDFIVIEVDVYHSGTVLSLIGDHSGYEEVHVNQFTALFVPTDGNSGISNLVWIDEQNGLMFSVGSTLEKSVMLHIAESIELLQSPN